MGRLFYPQARAILQVVLDGFGPSELDSDPFIIPILPKAVTVHRNSYRQADSWELEFDALDLPLDPQLIRGGAVEIFLFQVDGLEVEDRLVNRQLSSVSAGLNVSQRAPIDTVALNVAERESRSARLAERLKRRAEEIERFTLNRPPIVAGLFDEHRLEMSASGRTVIIQGQDYTDFLSRKQWPPKPNGRAQPIPTGRRIDKILREILKEADPTNTLKVTVRNLKDSELPTVQSTLIRGKKRGIPVGQDTSYWDVMYQLATRHSLILFVDGLSVVLSKPQNITDKEVHRVRKFTWGENIEKIQIQRHLGKEKVPRIIVQGYDQKGRTPITVSFPPGLAKPKPRRKGKKEATVKASRTRSKERSRKHPIQTSVNDDEYQIVPVRGITDVNILREAAEQLFNLRAKGEHKIQISTRDLKTTALKSDEEESILKLAAGDAIQIEWDPFNRQLLADDKIPPAQKAERLVQKGYGRAVAEAIAENFAKLEAFRRPLRVREVTYDYRVDNGITVEMELVDFIVIGGIRRNADAEIQETQGRGDE